MKNIIKKDIKRKIYIEANNRQKDARYQTYFSNSHGYANLGTDLSISSSKKELGYFWSIQAGFSPIGAAISQKHSKSCLTFSLM